jgi:Major Facilitator Superfamily
MAAPYSEDLTEVTAAKKTKGITPSPDDSSTQSSHHHVADDNAPTVNERRLLRKLDLKLLPALTFLYLLSFLDRSNVGNARVEGLVKDLHMSGDEYLTGLTLFFIGYVLFEVPAQIVMKVWSPRLWLPTLTFGWGVVSTLLGVVQSRDGFYVARFFLGVAESGLFPGIVYYLSFCELTLFLLLNRTGVGVYAHEECFEEWLQGAASRNALRTCCQQCLRESSLKQPLQETLRKKLLAKSFERTPY